ncbi:MAG: hypothetical protein ACRD1N_06255 [Terriglobia bacterium]
MAIGCGPTPPYGAASEAARKQSIAEVWLAAFPGDSFWNGPDHTNPN